jgi:hypothetical protein
MTINAYIKKGWGKLAIAGSFAGIIFILLSAAFISTLLF